VSSSSLLFIPFLTFCEDFPKIAYFLAGFFWAGFMLGIVLQIFLCVKIRKYKKYKDFKKARRIVMIILGASVSLGGLSLFLWSNNSYALPTTLFATLMSIEMLCIIKRMEKVK